MKKATVSRRIISVHLSFVLLLSFIALFPIKAKAVFTDYPIVFSNIGDTTKPPTQQLPKLSNETEVVGKVENGMTMVRISDLVDFLGVQDATSTSQPTKWVLKRNGQTLTFTENSTSFTSSTTYSLKNPANNQSTSYTVTWSGVSDCAAQKINGEKYVRLTTAANQLGCLVTGWDQASGKTRVCDWRVNKATPLSDSNTYIVGGPWLTNWSTLGSTMLAPHFAAREFQDKSSSSTNPLYSGQLKISAKQLQCAENVRYHYNNNSGMTLSSGFRSWYYNITIDNANVKSHHLQGRAWDSSIASLYAPVYEEFCGPPLSNGTTPPPISVGILWRTNVSNGKSGGYEIEKMPQKDINGKDKTWLHLQTPAT